MRPVGRRACFASAVFALALAVDAARANATRLESSFSSDDVIENDDVQFKAKTR